jgi:hypothetical protein
MRKLCLALALLASSFLFGQDSNVQQNMKDSKGQITVQGCVSRSGGDYTLIKQNPAMTYELQGTHGVKLRNYLGQRVEVTGRESTSLSTSSDAMNKTGSAAPTTLTVTSVRTIDKDCTVR